MILGIGFGAEQSSSMHLAERKHTLKSEDDIYMEEADRIYKINRIRNALIMGNPRKIVPRPRSELIVKPADQYYWGEKCRINGCKRHANVGWHVEGSEPDRDPDFPHAVKDPFYVCWHHIKLHNDRRHRWKLTHQERDETARASTKPLLRECPGCGSEVLAARQRLCPDCRNKHRLKTNRENQRNHYKKQRGPS